jgi:hypothetical protein
MILKYLLYFWLHRAHELTRSISLWQGGYSEKPEETTYTFNFWSLCDTFI